MIVAVTMCVFVSPLVVAGIVIGLVLFLSLLIIIIGSMRKKKHSHINTDAADGFSFGGSTGELRSECVDEFPPAFDFDSDTETSPIPISAGYPDAPPHYDECVGRDATQIFTPTDDPPPYSHTSHTHTCIEGAELPEGTWLAYTRVGSHHPIRLQDVSSVFVLSLDDLPPYEAVMEQQNRTIPLIASQGMKHTTE
ncbi:protein BEAN1 [Neoarius graeffei]|uniref:protein BEAN1 n=1 Tax=Neoarius graeffei TaxID=443677 RepID=UPI00298CB8F1|nr:protein BEAN1 [Neoarius graeffei]XP_060767853.1 protein BEAN1 [Neoarius graeffei]XP_060767854.1 protein BEAN1 [Neoarius graeffei]XP_060767855.1 protein BEAN1 [Neoarius graeffei]XP_060767856.1 protein BEAN1 [Neoarius graeffei]